MTCPWRNARFGTSCRLTIEHWHWPAWGERERWNQVFTWRMLHVWWPESRRRRAT